jgi:hypothetical protein
MRRTCPEFYTWSRSKSTGTGFTKWTSSHRHLGVCTDSRPARLLVLQPASHALAISRPRHVGDAVGEVVQSLAQRKHPQALALPGPIWHGVERGAPGVAHRGGDRRQLLREREARVAQAVTHVYARRERPQTLGGAVEPIGEPPFDPVRWLLLGCRTLKSAIGLGEIGGAGLYSVFPVSADPAMDNRGEIHLLVETAAVLFIGQKIDR